MSHSTVTVVVRHADTPAEAVQQAESMLEPYSEHLDVPHTAPIPTPEVERILSLATEDSLARKTLEEVTADPAARTSLLRVLGEYMTGDPSNGRWDGQTYGYHTTSNPDGRWDWYSIGGRWQGFYTLKDGTDSEACLLGECGAFGGDPAEALAGRADVARKEIIDIEGMRLMAGIEASALCDKYDAATQGIEAPESWGRTLARVVARVATRETVGASPVGVSAPAEAPGATLPALPGDLDTLSEFEVTQWAQNTIESMHEQSMLVAVSEIKAETDRLRRTYNDHPWMKALRTADLLPLFGSPHEVFKVGSGGREALVRERRDGVLMTHSLLTDEGWMEQGRMLMFGMSDDTMSRAEWVERFNGVIDGLPDDAWLVLVDAHS